MLNRLSISLFLVTFTFFFEGCSKSKKSPPNIIIILTDDQGYADLGSYGAVGFDTPNIDQLADEGLKFTVFQLPKRF